MSEGQNVFHHNLFVYFEESLRGTTELSECFTKLAEQTKQQKQRYSPENNRECGSVVVSALDFRSEGRWFDAQSLPCDVSLDKKLYPHIVYLHPGVYMGTATYCWG